MPDLAIGEILQELNETQQRIAGILRAVLSTDLDSWEQDRRKTLQHPQAEQYILMADKPLKIAVECDWFYIFSAKPPVDFFPYYVMELGSGVQTIIPRNVKRYGPVKKGLVFLPVGINVNLWFVWGIGTKDSNLSFQAREADEYFDPQDLVEAVIVPGPNPIFPIQTNERIQYSLYNIAGGGDVQMTDATGIPGGTVFPAGTISWIDGRAASDILYLKPYPPAVGSLVTATGFMVSRTFPSV